MKIKDVGRKWMWCFLGGMGAFQLYFVRELLAAFALFAVGFALIGAIVVSLFLLQRAWGAGMARIQQHARPVIGMARHGLSFAGDVAKRPFTRPGSEPVQ